MRTSASSGGELTDVRVAPARRFGFVGFRTDAQATTAREWFDRYPKAAYMTEIEFWRELSDGRIEFVMRRLPTAE